jgi:glutaminase
MCDYIKTGRYIPELKVNENVHYGINLATSNQKIYKKGIDYEN